MVAENSAGIESGARGITAAVLTDQWTWTGVAGADGTGRRLQNNTTMAIASITKTFVAAEVLRLARAGTVELDKPLSTYVKHKLTANGATVRQHLAMRAGLPDFLPGDYQALEKEFAEAPSRHWTPAQVLAHHSAALGGPGSPFAYSNPSYLLLGMLVESVTKQPLAAVLRRDLVTPARLARVAVQDRERPPPPVANTRSRSARADRTGTCVSPRWRAPRWRPAGWRLTLRRSRAGATSCTAAASYRPPSSPR